MNLPGLRHTEYNTMICVFRIRPAHAGAQRRGWPVGVQFTRDYRLIVDELSEAIQRMDGFYGFLEMSAEQWNLLSDDEQKQCARALADDVIYALGGLPTVEIGDGVATYDRRRHVIKLKTGENRVHVVYLM